MNPAPSLCSILKAKRLERINKLEGAGVNPAPSKYSTIKAMGFKELIKKEGAG